MWPVQSGTGRLPRRDDLIFPVDGSGGKMRSRAAKYGLVDSIREATGRDDLVFHDLRHTAATRMVQAGVNIRVVQKALGHSSIRITEKYIHTEDAFAAQEMSKLSLRRAAKVVPLGDCCAGGE